jgi:PAS domain S-box-containing protein
LSSDDRTPSIADKIAELRSEAGLNTILDGIGEGFYAVDRDWRILLFNSEAQRHFKVKAEDVLGRILWEAFPRTRETGLGQLYFRVMESRETIRSETESIVFPGQWMSFRLFPLGDGIGVVFRDITDRRKAEAQRDLLIEELAHRIKNTLSIVLSIATQTFGDSGLDPALRRAFEARLVALSNVHGILSQHSWDSADLQEVMLTAIRPHDDQTGNRFAVHGPMLRLGPKSAVALSMAVHELCTNAIKYGALSTSGGRIQVNWTADAGRFRWTWRESDGPLVLAPSGGGFGSRMIERILAAQLAGRVTLDYAPSGLVCVIDAPLEAIRDNPARK